MQEHLQKKKDSFLYIWPWHTDDLDLDIQVTLTFKHIWMKRKYIQRKYDVLFIWSWSWSNDTDTQTWPRYGQVYICIPKMKFLDYSSSKVTAWTDRNTKKDRLDWKYYLSAYADGDKEDKTESWNWYENLVS